MSEEHYSLRWNNHQNHMLTFMEELLKKEEYCDVSLVSDERWTIRAHKVVLSACSPFFSKIFSENPCKHPVIVLKDFSRADVQRIIDFMYKGEISVGKEQLQSLLKVAEDLQVRGLSNYEGTSPSDKASICANRATPTPSPSPNDFERNFYSPGRFPMPATAPRTPMERISPYSPTLSLPPMFDPSMKMPHLPKLNFPDHHHHPFLTHHQECQPRRKQMRPRRRSGDLCTPQDLSTHQQQNNNHNNNNNNNNNNNHNSNNNNNNNNVASLGPAPVKPASTPPEETAQNLCTKRKRPDKDAAEVVGGPVLKQENVALIESGMMPEPSGSPEMDLSMSSSNKEYISRASPPAVHGLPPTLNMKQEVDSHSPVHFPPSVNALAMTPPHAKYFGLDTPLLFSPAGLDGCRSALFDMPDARSTPDPQLFMKKKMGRPKGQHSAPRGGPPRSWTNAELTEALQNVWNKKMTTSQASRIFGIPYNSLLMYVRGKYGKSLKLEQLRKDCIGGPAAPMDLLPNININNNNKTDRDNNEQIQPNTRPPSTEEPPPHPQPFLNALPFAAHGFFPDFAPNFPMPVSMVHLMAPSERNRDGYGPPPHHDDERDRESDRAEKENEDEPSMFRPPVLSVDDTRKLVQQNGQD